VKLWHLAADIELSLHGESKPDLVRALYDAMIDLRVITPQTVLNYAKFELEKLYFEKAIQVLERGIALFPWPHCRDIWLFYLDLVVGQSKQRFSTERVRDLFEQAVRDVDPKFASVFFFKFFQFELERGLASDAVAVLTKAVACIPLHEKLGFYQLATARMMELSGLAGARRILQGAIDAMTETAVKSPAADRYIITLCLEYARFQAEVGQADRARKLYEHGSQFANPNKADLLFFWDMWKNFEVEHGSEDTYKEMKRTRRLVDVQYSDKHFNTLDVGMEVGSTAPAEEPESVSVSAAPKIDISKLRQMAQMKKQGQAAVPAGEAFLASDTFAGSKPGYVFTSGPQGVGYYRDSSSA
jgi:pre-mRNA-splicing factor SYF1